MRMQSTAQGNEGMKTASGVFLLAGDIHLRARARQRGVPISAGQYSEKGKGSTRRGTALQLCARLQLEPNSHEPTVTLIAVLSEGCVSPKSPHALYAPTFSPGKGHSPEPLDRIYAGSARCDSPTSGREAPPSPRASRARYGNRADAGLSLPHLRAPRTIRAPLPGELDPPGTRSLPSSPLRHALRGTSRSAPRADGRRQRCRLRSPWQTARRCPSPCLRPLAESEFPEPPQLG